MNYENQENFENFEKSYRGNEHTCQCTNVQNHVYANKSRCTCVRNLHHLLNLVMFRASKLFFIIFYFIYLYKSNGYPSSLLYTQNTRSFLQINACSLRLSFQVKAFLYCLQIKLHHMNVYGNEVLAFACISLPLYVCLLCIKLFFLF